MDLPRGCCAFSGVVEYAGGNFYTANSLAWHQIPTSLARTNTHSHAVTLLESLVMSAFRFWLWKIFNTKFTEKTQAPEVTAIRGVRPYLPDKNGKCAEADMKKIIGRLSQKLICIASVASRATFAASAGRGVPC